MATPEAADRDASDELSEPPTGPVSDHTGLGARIKRAMARVFVHMVSHRLPSRITGYLARWQAPGFIL